MGCVVCRRSVASRPLMVSVAPCGAASDGRCSGVRDRSRCGGCGGTLRIIACIGEWAVIEMIPSHRRHAGHSERSGSGTAISGIVRV